MRKHIVFSLLFSMLCNMSCMSDEQADTRATVNTAQQLYQDGHYQEAIETINKILKKKPASVTLLLIKYNALKALGKLNEALETYNQIIVKQGESPDIILDKVRLLTDLKQYDEALQTAIRVDIQSYKKSPYLSLEIARLYLLKKDTNQAVTWLEASVNRDFLLYNYLLTDTFKHLHSDNRFIKLIEQIKSSIGVGKPAKWFRISQYPEGTFHFNNNTGKIILLDFWATWCPPCVAELPNLKKLYEFYREEGLEIISISADVNQSVFKKFIDRHPIPWINGFSGNGKNDAVINLYRITSFPTYVLIDRNGVVRSVSGMGGKHLEENIEKLLTEQ